MQWIGWVLGFYGTIDANKEAFIFLEEIASRNFNYNQIILILYFFYGVIYFLIITQFEVLWSLTDISDRDFCKHSPLKVI